MLFLFGVEREIRRDAADIENALASKVNGFLTNPRQIINGMLRQVGVAERRAGTGLGAAAGKFRQGRDNLGHLPGRLAQGEDILSQLAHFVGDLFNGEKLGQVKFIIKNVIAVDVQHINAANV